MSSHVGQCSHALKVVHPLRNPYMSQISVPMLRLIVYAEKLRLRTSKNLTEIFKAPQPSDGNMTSIDICHSIRGEEP